MSQIPIPIKWIPVYILDISITPWKDRRIVAVYGLFDGFHLRSFAELQTRYGLPSSDFLRYAQIKHLLDKYSFRQCNVPSKIITMLQNPTPQKVKGKRIFNDLATKNNQFHKISNMSKGFFSFLSINLCPVVRVIPKSKLRPIWPAELWEIPDLTLYRFIEILKLCTWNFICRLFMFLSYVL